MTGIMGVAELGGMTTLVTGGALDRGHERRVFLLGMTAVCASSLIALGGSVTTFAISYTVLILGVSNLTVAGHAWIGHRVPFARRSRAIGAFETSWAISLLVGAPVLAVLIGVFGWRGPYVALAIGAVFAIVAVRTFVAVSGHRVARRERGPAPAPLPRSAWPPMIASAATASAGLGIFVISGAWLEDAHGVSTGGLGLIAAMFGAIELVASTSVAAVADRLGTRRSVAGGLTVLGVGAAVMAVSTDSRALAVIGLITFLAGFEYAFVSSLTLVTEAAPHARGRAIGVSNAFGTVARSAAIIASGQLYEAFGLTGSLLLAVGAATVAMAMTAIARTTS
jgi:predicted MFS family arabinose efflux permease